MPQGRPKLLPASANQSRVVLRGGACNQVALDFLFATGIEACALLRSFDVRDNLLDDPVRMVAQLGGLKRLERIDARQNPFSRHFTG